MALLHSRELEKNWITLGHSPHVSFGRLKPREAKSVVQGHTAKGEIEVAEGGNLWFPTPPSSEAHYL